MRQHLSMLATTAMCALSAVLFLIVIGATRVDAQAVRATNVFSQTPNGGGTINPTAGRITTLAGAARQIQFAAKVIF